jgi:chromate transport protein ChrA
MNQIIKTGILTVLIAVLAIFNWYDFNAEFKIVLLIFWIVFTSFLLIDNENEKEKKESRWFYLLPIIGFILLLLERVGDYFN